MAGLKKYPKILFVKQHSTNAKFVLNDVDILKEKFDVSIYDTPTKSNLTIIFTLLKQFIYLLFNAFRFKLVYIWFADYHSFLPVMMFKIFRRKSIICAGGYEATYIPEINCGVFTNETFAKSVRRFAATCSLRNCDCILPVDESLITNENTYIYSDTPGKEPLRDGVKHFIPDIKTNMRIVYPGYDSVLFRKRENIPKEQIIMSAGLAPNEYEIKRKGFDILMQAAKTMTDTKFVFIGFVDEIKNKYKKLNLQNLEIHGIVSYEELIEYYSRAKVFAQISMFEGLPSTICEAMLCECIPVGSNVNGIPKIVGENGFIVMNKNISEIISILKAAIEAPAELGKKARQYIIDNFPLEKRKKELDKILTEIIG